MRRHQIIWVCDRCGFNDVVMAKTETHLPNGWVQTHTDPTYDLCSGCRGAYADLFSKFMSEIKDPEVEARTIVDDELNELDPEVDDDEA